MSSIFCYIVEQCFSTFFDSRYLSLVKNNLAAPLFIINDKIQKIVGNPRGFFRAPIEYTILKYIKFVLFISLIIVVKMNNYFF